MSQIKPRFLRNETKLNNTFRFYNIIGCIRAYLVCKLKQQFSVFKL